MENLNIKKSNTADPDFIALEKLLDAELRMEFPDDIDDYHAYNKFKTPIKAIILYKGETPVACGGLKELVDHIEIKRMFVHPDFRRKGYSRIVLRELESWGKSLGMIYSILETGDDLFKARNMYTSSGYQIIPNFPPYENMKRSICMKKVFE